MSRRGPGRLPWAVACRVVAVMAAVAADDARAGTAAGPASQPASASARASASVSASQLGSLAARQPGSPAASQPGSPPALAAAERPAGARPAPSWLHRWFGAARWNVNLQATFVWQAHPGFHAAYDGPHSLSSSEEAGNTLSATLYVGYRPWRGAEIFVNPEIIESVDLSGLHGLGGLSNAENQKSGGPTAALYLARAFLRQTIGVGGETAAVEAGPNQFPAAVPSRRVVITVGQMALTDVFDANWFAHDGRTQFLSWALLAYGASDYAANARGYTVGLTLEYYHDAWAFRGGHFAQPRRSNGLALDYRLWAHFGDSVEVEHAHRLRGRPGKVRLYGFLNYARMAGFTDAIAYARQQGIEPDLTAAPLDAVRRDRAKLGFGATLEQYLTADLGWFARFSMNDGRTETFAFTEIDQSFATGLVMGGRLWRRTRDAVGFSFIENGISADHRAFLAAGGLGFFIGDGRLDRYRPELVLEAYYSFFAFKGFWASVDYQQVWNPAYNPARGPVSLFGCRGHVEF